MSKLLKGIILIVTLGLPVTIYLFLQTFGENMYALPVYPETSYLSADCGTLTVDYAVSKLTCDSTDVVVLGDQQTYLFHFPDPFKTDIAGEMNEMRRLVEETKPLDYRLVTMSNEEQVDKWDKLAASQAETRYWVVTSACADGLEQVMNCQLLLSQYPFETVGSKSRMVLVDRVGRIRGFYASAEKGEIDRLLVELDVLMQEK
jgi:protein SCO1